MENVGYAALQIIPSFQGFQSNLERGSNGALIAAGRRGGATYGSAAGREAAHRFGTTFGSVARTAIGFGIGGLLYKIGKDAIGLEATYSATMRQIEVATGAPQRALDKLDKLSMRLGADTIFSANDAAEAMLELAKNGLSPATIQAGALKSALTLAAAGGVGLASAAGTMSNTLNAFRLRGKDAASVAAALAGAANASSADIDGMAQGLQQVGTVAHATGLNVQETTGLLAALANAGIQGSDAGTSLKTMLINLVPSTDKARTAADAIGLSFVKANGEFKSAVEIAGAMQESFSKLAPAQRSTALQTIFGTDAQRAANILVDEGSDGIKKYIKSTSDRTQADKLAKASMEGTSGAIEQLKGSLETAELQLGKGFAPLVEDVANGLSNMVNKGDFEKWGKQGADAARNFYEEAKPLVQEVLPAMGETLGTVLDTVKAAAPYAKDLVDAFNSLPSWAKKGIVLGGAGAYAGSKLGLGSMLLGGKGGSGGGLLGSLASKAAPLPVFVTNEGFGGIPGATGGGKPGGGVTPLLGGKPGFPARPGMVGGSLLATGAVATGFGLADAYYGHPGTPVYSSGGYDLSSDAKVQDYVEMRKQIEATADLFKTLPSQVQTDIVLHGAPESKREAIDLAKTYDLTKAQRLTLFRTSGIPLSNKQVAGLVGLYRDAERPRNAHVTADTAQAEAALNRVITLMNQVSAGRYTDIAPKGQSAGSSSGRSGRRVVERPAHVYVDGQKFDGRIRDEIDADHDMTGERQRAGAR